MERREEVKIKNGDRYNRFFPQAMMNTITKKKGATVNDTIRFIPNVVSDTLFHTAKISQILKGNTLDETCRNIWHFVYDHIAYKKDEDGKEQVRSPARTWQDRHTGVDCDCYTVFISSILSNLKIRHILRITKYGKDHFQHIYPIVPLPGGRYITIDCVVKQYNYEEPYTEKKDTNMDLEYLNGVGELGNLNSVDAADLVGLYDDKESLSELGRLFRRKKKHDDDSGGGSSEGGGGEERPKKKRRFRDYLKQGLHLTNRLNPATVLLRNGVLAAMKTNLFKVAQRLKYAYMSEDQAREKGVDMEKFARLKKVLDKLENIFYGAGGKPKNLKKAMLKGRGNRDHEVSGLGYTPDNMDGMDHNTPLPQLLGHEIYHSENVEGMEGLGELGEPFTAASIAAATGAIGAIAGLLKSIGNIFPKKHEDFPEGEEGSGEGSEETPKENSGGEGDSSEKPAESVEGGVGKLPWFGKGKDNKKPPAKTNHPAPPPKDKPKPKPTPKPKKEEDDDDEDDDDDNEKKSNKSSAGNNSGGGLKGFWEKHKNWLKPTAIGVGVAGVLYGAYKMFGGGKSAPAKQSLSGVPKSKKKGGKKAQIKSKKHKKKTSVALL